MIRDVTAADAPALAAIYNPYITDTVITFETAEVSAADMAARVERITGLGLPWLVLEEDGEVIGYAYAGPFKERAAFAHTLETSIYLHQGRGGGGRGRRLYDALLEALKALTEAESALAPVHVLVAGIALPNEPSVALHEGHGWTKVAHFEQVGFKLGRWVDVGYWQLTLGA